MNAGRWIIVAGLLAALPVWGQAPRALPAGQLPDDVRLGDLKTLDAYFPFMPVKSKEEWSARAAKLRRQVLLATGLWPMPPKTPLKAIVHGKVTRDDFTVERVILESHPGHFLTGSLYRPLGRTGKLPVVLCPHGHWKDGRFYANGEDLHRRDLSVGAERFEVSGRYPLQARCVQLARMGCVVFHYDMEGYADSIQFVHRAGVRAAMNTTTDWGFFSPQAELRQQNMLGLQTWNSVRALDFVLDLPDVDQSRVGVTGASGGGTQTFLLSGIDDRITCAVPAVMVSTAMQGGCTCENSCYLRVGTGNIDLAGLTAPRPLAMIAANDWTKEIMTKGYPDLQGLYKMLGADKLVHAEAFTHFPHNYNAVSRSVMYTWINRHFNLGYPEPVVERDFAPLSVEQLTVWTGKHKAPAGDQVGDAHERALIKHLTKTSEQQMKDVTPTSPDNAKKFRDTVGGAIEAIVGRDYSQVGRLEYKLANKTDKGGYLLMTGTVKALDHQEHLPLTSLHPKERWNQEVVLWLDDAGKQAIVTADGQPAPGITDLVLAGYSVISFDLVGQGEFTKDGKSTTEQRYLGYRNSKEAWSKAACYTFGYNHSLFAQRVHDVMTAVKFIQTDQHLPSKIHLVALGSEVGPVAAAARFLAGPTVAKAAISTGDFRFASINSFGHPMFTPGIVKYQDVPALLALNAPQPLFVADAGADLSTLVTANYAAAGAAANVKIAAPSATVTKEIIDWLSAK